VDISWLGEISLSEDIYAISKLGASLQSHVGNSLLPTKYFLNSTITEHGKGINIPQDSA